MGSRKCIFDNTLHRIFILLIPLCFTLNTKNNSFQSKTAVSFICIVKPTGCTNVSNLFYFGMTIYMFRTVFPPIIRSSRLYVQQQAFVSMQTAVCLTNACCCMYSLELLMMDGDTVRNM